MAVHAGRAYIYFMILLDSEKWICYFLQHYSLQNAYVSRTGNCDHKKCGKKYLRMLSKPSFVGFLSIDAFRWNCWCSGRPNCCTLSVFRILWLPAEHPDIDHWNPIHSDIVSIMRASTAFQRIFHSNHSRLRALIKNQKPDAGKSKKKMKCETRQLFFQLEWKCQRSTSTQHIMNYGCTSDGWRCLEFSFK